MDEGDNAQRVSNGPATGAREVNNSEIFSLLIFIITVWKLHLEIDSGGGG
jgi:hypothetical protein